jgi:hypothetical protein
LVEFRALRGECVERRRLDVGAVKPDIFPTEIVSDNVEDIGRCACCFSVKQLQHRRQHGECRGAGRDGEDIDRGRGHWLRPSMSTSPKGLIFVGNNSIEIGICYSKTATQADKNGSNPP